MAGGDFNTAAGDFSFVVGRNAKNSNDGHDGVFMFADSQNADFTSTGANQFLARAGGGFGFNTNSIPSGIEAVFQSRGGININTDLYLRTAAHGRGINLAMLPTAGAAEFRIAQFDGTTFVDRFFLFANGDFQVTAQAFKPGGGSWASSSDHRLKSDIEPLSGVLERMLALHGVTFEYLDPDPARRPAGQHIGFIAQEVAEVFPDWVETDRDGYLTVGSRGFEALTVEALRELRAEAATVDQGQKRRLDALERENLRLRDQNRSLEARLARLEAMMGGNLEADGAR